VGANRQLTQSGKLYPNPTRAGAIIHLPSLHKKMATVTLYDVRGAMIKRVVQSVVEGFKMPDVTPGIYMIRVEESSSIKTYRIMVQ
jgi:hypothetical protein